MTNLVRKKTFKEKIAEIGKSVDNKKNKLVLKVSKKTNKKINKKIKKKIKKDIKKNPKIIKQERKSNW